MTHLIIGIHGLSNKPPAAALAEGWEQAIREGLKRNMDVHPTSLNFHSVYWADVMYDEPIENNPEPYHEAPGDGPLPIYEDSWRDVLRARAKDIGGSALDATKRWFGIDAVADEILEHKLEDLSRYYNEEDVRAELRGRLKNRLRRRDYRGVMVIAHSMGSIIAYDALRELGREEPDLHVDHFVTIGSPLGIPHVKLKMAEESDRLRTPSVVKRWTNMADRRDLVSLDTHLTDDYDANMDDVKVQDDLVVNGYVSPNGKENHHKSYGYLRAPELTRLIASFI